VGGHHGRPVHHGYHGGHGSDPRVVVGQAQRAPGSCLEGEGVDQGTDY
jgi:hypothetical protein